MAARLRGSSDQEGQHEGAMDEQLDARHCRRTAGEKLIHYIPRVIGGGGCHEGARDDRRIWKGCHKGIDKFNRVGVWKGRCPWIEETDVRQCRTACEVYNVHTLMHCLNYCIQPDKRTLCSQILVGGDLHLDIMYLTLLNVMILSTEGKLLYN